MNEVSRQGQTPPGKGVDADRGLPYSTPSPNLEKRMERRRLGCSDLMVSEIGFGGHQRGGYGGDFEVPLGERVKIIERALELGIDYFDTTEEHEAVSLASVFREMGGRPEHVTVASMYPAYQYHRTEYPGVGGDMKRRVAAEIEKRLVDFGPMDVFNLCGDGLPYSRERTLGALEALEEAREQGKVKHFGFSSHTMDYALSMITNHPEFCLVMFPYNLVIPAIGDILFPVAEEHDVAVVGMKVVAARGLFDLGIEAADYGEDVSLAQAAIKWVLKSSQVACTIPAMNALAEVEENAAASGQALTPVEEQMIEDLRAAFEEKAKTERRWYFYRDWTRRLHGDGKGKDGKQSKGKPADVA